MPGMKGILRSISDGNTGRLSKILGRRKGLKINRDELSYSLMEAVRLGKDDCIPALLMAGADPNCEDEDGKTALYIAIEKGGADPHTIKQLLRSGAKPNQPTFYTQLAPLHVAAKKGFQVAVSALLDSKAKVDKRDVEGRTPLMYAAKEGHVTIVRTLLREGADPDAKNLQNEAAIHTAAKNGHVHVIYELLGHHANPNDRDNRGQTPLYLACKTPHIEVIEALLQYDCDVNGQDTQNGKTILHWAIQNSNTYLVDMLLRQGASTNVRDTNWETPFMMALNVGNEEIISMLMESGCDVTVTDRSFNTALHIAAKDGRRDIIVPLIKAGLDANLKGAAGLTPLMLAALGGYPDIVFTLLRHGARPDMADRHRATALMYAVLSKASDKIIQQMVVSLIRASCKLDQSANVQAIVKSLSLNLGGIEIMDRLYSPLEIAYLREKPRVFSMLIQAGCDVNNFYCDHIHGSGNSYRYAALDSSSSWALLKMLYTEQKRPKSLKELSRRSVLQSLGAKVQDKLAILPVSDRLKRYLNFADLEDVEQRYDMTDVVATSNDFPEQTSQFSRDDRRRKTVQSGYKYQPSSRQQQLQQQQQKQNLPSPSWADRERNTSIYGTFRRKKHERRATAPDRQEPAEQKQAKAVQFHTPQPAKPPAPAPDTQRLRTPSTPVSPGRYITPIPEGIMTSRKSYNSPLSPPSSRRTTTTPGTGPQAPLRSPRTPRSATSRTQASPKPSRRTMSPSNHTRLESPSNHNHNNDMEAPLSPRSELKRFAGTLSLNDIGGDRQNRLARNKPNGHVPNHYLTPPQVNNSPNHFQLQPPPQRRPQTARSPQTPRVSSQMHSHTNNAHGHFHGHDHLHGQGHGQRDHGHGHAHHFHGLPDTVYVAHESETPTSLSPEPETSPFQRNYHVNNNVDSISNDGSGRSPRRNSGSTSSEEPTKTRSRIPVPTMTARTSLRLPKGTRRGELQHPAKGVSSAVYSDPGTQPPNNFRRTWSFKV